MTQHAAPTPPALTAPADLCYTPATELARLIRTRAISPVEVLDAVLERVQDVDARVQAFMTLDTDHAREAARAAEAAVMRGDPLGPLHGIPVSVKDLVPTAGLRTTFGSKRTEHHVPAIDALTVTRLRAAGALIFGKTNTPAYGHKDMTDNLVAPASRNPWNLSRTPGGSSGGAAAAVAAGLGPLALGGDGAGSIRIPAALCGVYGLKPSFGRIPAWPNADFWSARSHPGPLTRTVRDAALLLSVLAGPDGRDPLSIDAAPEEYPAACAQGVRGLRVAWSADFGYAPVDPEVRDITTRAARRFQELGGTVVEATPAWDDPAEWHRTLYRAGYAAKQGALLDQHPEWVDPSLRAVIEAGRSVTLQQYIDALSARSAFYEQARQFMDGFDVLLTPAMPCGAWPYDGQPGPIDGQMVQQVPGGRWPLMFPFNLTGWPAASVPCGFTSEGLPVGLQIVAPWHDDGRCLAASAAFEAIQPWAGTRPPL
jgi:Asp-tRNA(Asn)/Glu-tRNA(Gln) amidotransferase A subunit family amidase